MTSAAEYGAEETLDRMLQIIDREKLTRGTYATVLREADFDAEAPCGGAQCCMIGAAWLANGVRMEVETDDDGYIDVVLPNVGSFERREFYEERPELGRAVAALNEAAEARVEELRAAGEINLMSWSPDAIESFFESAYVGDLDPDERNALMREVVVDARARLRPRED